VLSALEATLATSGLNLVGAASIEAYDAGVPAAFALGRLHPWARGAIVIGNGGGDFWKAFRDFCALRPEHEAEAEPLDAFTQAVVEAAVRPFLAGVETRVLYPFRFPDDPVSFIHLAACAGLGRRSLVGVLVHPVFGPWIALRAAVLVPFAVSAPRPADGFDPCPGCVERACIPACPVGAVTAAGWDVPRCVGHRLSPDDACGSRCHARFDCVVGREHRYPPDALAYHQGRARGSMLATRAR
jgi:hypothetical protein